MGMVLGKPLNFKPNDYKIVPPTDCDIPENQRTTAPFERSAYDRPNTFTVRLLEYRLHRHLPKIRELEAEGPYPRDYSKVERLHQTAHDYIATLPAAYRLENPDTTSDDDCPMLASQRPYLVGTVWMFILVLHRPYIFSIPQSRTEVLNAGIKMLNAQQRFYLTLKPYHYRMFTLAYLTVEPCVAMLAVLIAFPRENATRVNEAFRCIRESLARLNTIRGTNKVAGQGADVIHSLLLRAQKNHPSPILSSTLSPPARSLPDQLMTTTSNGSNTLYSMSEQPLMYTPTMPFGNTAEWNMQVPQAFSAGTPISSNYAFDSTPFRPVADLAFNDLTAEMAQDGFDEENSSLRMTTSSLPHSFRGDFGQGSFWNFVNNGTEM
jgi:hypothetical protein